MDVAKVFPDKLADTIVVRVGFVTAIQSLIARRWSLDAAIVQKGPSRVGDFGIQDEPYIFVKDGNGIGPTLREARETDSTNRGLDSGEVARGDI